MRDCEEIPSIREEKEIEWEVELKQNLKGWTCKGKGTRWAFQTGKGGSMSKGKEPGIA